MSYRPYYTNTQIDGQALNGAIAGIGSLFGKGKMTATQGVDPTTGRPTMNYSTTGGDFWDNVMGRQAQKANLAAQGLGFKTDMDLYQNQGTLNQQAKFNSGERLNQAADAETIFRQQGQNTQEGLNSNNPLMRARALEALNKIAELQDQGKLFDTGLNYERIANQARIPGAQLENTQASTQGQRMQNASEFIKQGYLGPKLQSEIDLNKAHANYYGIPKQAGSSLHFQPNAKGGGMVFDANTGEVTFVDPEMVDRFKLDTIDPKTGQKIQAFPERVPTGKRVVTKIPTGVTKNGARGLPGSDTNAIPSATGGKLSPDELKALLEAMRAGKK